MLFNVAAYTVTLTCSRGLGGWVGWWVCGWGDNDICACVANMYTSDILVFNTYTMTKRTCIQKGWQDGRANPLLLHYARHWQRCMFTHTYVCLCCKDLEDTTTALINFLNMVRSSFVCSQRCVYYVYVYLLVLLSLWPVTQL